MANGNGAWFERSMANGLIATIAWGILLIIYSTFRALKIDAPGLDVAFQLLSGGYVGLLTLLAGKKSQKVQDEVEQLKEVAKKQHPESAGDLE